MTRDEIAYRLVYHGEAFDVGAVIVETIGRLPEEVAEFALEHCVFTSAGESVYGMVLPGRLGVDCYRGREPGNLGRAVEGDKWFVLLADPLPPEDAHSIVAHEIAHAWRRDDKLTAIGGAEVEVSACQLVRGWGFTGLGCDVDHATRWWAPEGK